MPALPEDILSFFLSLPEGPRTAVPYILRYKDSPIFTDLKNMIDSVAEASAIPILQEPGFKSIFGSKLHDAKVESVVRLIFSETQRTRLHDLRHGTDLPYSIPALEGIKVDHEGMIPIAGFGFNGNHLVFNNHAFMMFPTTVLAHSTYWLLNSFYEQGIAPHVSVRLDPYLHGRSDNFPSYMYKMTVYGKDLDWDRIANLSEPEHGRWMSDNDQSVISEYCWDPRGDEIHFVCEELPSSTENYGRYLHAIFSKKTKEIIHLDGALRIFTDEDLFLRRKNHVRHAGKSGVRKKVFRLDHPISTNSFSQISKSFFVWNSDVESYF